VEQGFLLPDTSEETTAEFWAGCARGELLVQACGSCGKLRHPPRPMCPYCRSIDVKWVPTSGRGHVWSYVIPHAPLLPAYSPLAPYNVIVVALEEDPTIRFVGNLVASADAEINELDPHSVEVGEPVQVVFHQIEDVTLPRWIRR
jgi:uncharacterized OB-fold protein